MITHKVQTGIAFVISVPIGNPKDITLRALDILRETPVIACEDTRHCKELLKSLDIKDEKLLLSYYDQNERKRIDSIIDILKQGKNVALVSDAGTPNVSDPGYHFINHCNDHAIPVVGIPGPSSVTLALSICPIGGNSFYFSGFAPEKSTERIKHFKKIRSLADRIVFFEAPHRLLDHLEDSQTLFKGKIFLARELTKKYEETIYDEIPEIIKHFKANKPLGEFALIYPRQEESYSLDEVKREIKYAIEENLKPNEILRKVQQFTNMTRRELYDLITEIKHHLKKD